MLASWVSWRKGDEVDVLMQTNRLRDVLESAGKIAGVSDASVVIDADEQVTVAAQGNGATYSCVLYGDVEGRGTLGAKLKDAIGAVDATPDDDIRLSTIDGHARIGVTTIKAYPEILPPGQRMTPVMPLQWAAFARAVQVLAGIPVAGDTVYASFRLAGGPDGWSLTAWDGHRVGRVRSDTSMREDVVLLLPAHVLRRIVDLGWKAGRIEADSGRLSVAFTSGRERVRLRPLAGQFPDQFTDLEQAAAVVNRDELYRALAAGPARINLRATPNGLAVGEEVMKPISVDEELDVRLDRTQLRQALRAIPDGRVVLAQGVSEQHRRRVLVTGMDEELVEFLLEDYG